MGRRMGQGADVVIIVNSPALPPVTGTAGDPPGPVVGPVRLAMPLRIAGGRVATVAQDGPEDIAQSVALLLATLPGERRSIPDYGLADLLGSGYSIEDIADAIVEWEERADPADVEFALNTLIEQQVRTYPASPDTTEEA